LQKERLKRPSRCPDSLWQLIEACWQQQPEARPSFQTILHTLKQLEAEMQQQQQQHEADMQGMSQYQHSAGAGAAAPEAAGAAILLHQQQ
jgi:hypothetical protein